VLASANKHFSALPLVLLFITTGQVYASEEPDTVNRQDDIKIHQATINGINLRSREDDIIRTLGQPLSVKEGFDEPLARKSKTYFYKGLRIYLIENEIYNLRCKRKDCMSFDGIRVGDSKEKIISVYGRGRPPYSDPEKSSISFGIQGLDRYLVFHFRKHRVVEIELFVDYV